MRILIAEDEQVISMQYCLVLEERGHDVTVTNDGEECMNVYRTALGFPNGYHDNEEKGEEHLVSRGRTIFFAFTSSI